MPSSYTLGARFQAFVKGLVESGRYNNASEVVRDGLRLLEDREKLREIKMAELRRLAEEGRLSGLSDEDGEAVLDRLEAKYRAMAKRSPNS
jgi:antitoxin ParD1/3/4